MSDYAISKFVPLPDVAPLPDNCYHGIASDRSAQHLACLGLCSVDAVEDFPPDDPTSAAHNTEATATTGLIAEGDLAFAKGYFREAVHAYTRVLKTDDPRSEKEVRAKALAKRSATFAMMCCELRLRPVGACALYGMESSNLASLALKDAERVIDLYPRESEGYLRRAFALYLSERYLEAKDVCLEGIQWNLSNPSLKECLQLIQGQLSGALPHVHSSHTDGMRLKSRMQVSDDYDFECMLCLKLMYEPVTTPCGHSFCSSCVQRSLDHSNKCPMCRTVMHVSRALPVSVTLKKILSRLFPEEYEQRKREIDTTKEPTQDSQTCHLPLFVLFTLFPGEKISLNVFEPRYRLMIRRVMEGNRRFGMIQACPHSQHGIASCGTECEIVECEPLADGRYILEVVGRRRFDVLEMSEQDGYRVVKARYFRDRPVAPESEEWTTIERHATSVKKLESVFRSRGLFHRQSGLRWDVLDKSERDAETLSFLACALLVNPDGTPVRRRFLETRSTSERMEWVLGRNGLLSNN